MKTQQPAPKRRLASVDEKIAETGKRLAPLILMDRDSSLSATTIWDTLLVVRAMTQAGIRIIQRGSEVEFSVPAPTPEIEAVLQEWVPRVASMVSRYASIMADIDEPTVPADWCIGVEPGGRYPAQCSEMSLAYVLAHDIPSMRLVRGTVQHRGMTVEHVWVHLPGDESRSDIVFDGVVQRFSYWDDYQRCWQARIIRTYTRDDVLAAQRVGTGVGA